MGKAGEKQKRRPKFKDKKQSERFKETARQLGPDESSDAFDRIADEMARTDEAKAHIKNSDDLIRKGPDEISDAQRHVDKSMRAVEASKRRLKKKTD